MAKKSDCDKKYVFIKKSGCSIVKRVVHEDTNGDKYIKLNGKTYLRDVRGKYRFSDKTT